jgi:cyclic beta-1,2-glucan synthetase
MEMLPNPDTELGREEVERAAADPLDPGSDEQPLRSNAAQLAHKLGWQPSVKSSRYFIERARAVIKALKPVLGRLHGPTPKAEVSEDFHWLHENVNLLYTEMQGIEKALKPLLKRPHVRTPSGVVVPRIAALAEGFLTASERQFSDTAFTAYLSAFQASTVLKIQELWGLVPALKLVLLEQIALRGARVLEDKQGQYGVGACVRSLRDIGQTSWKDLLEPLIVVDRVLREDPAGGYARMDFDSRDLYRTKLAKIAEHSDFSEMEVAHEALALARAAQQLTDSNPRVTLRRSHIGYYLVAEGVDLLQQRVAFRAPLLERMQSYLRKHPDEFYLPAIVALTFVIMSTIVLKLIGAYSSPGLILLSILALLLPCSQSAVQLVNHLATSLLTPEILPKFDLSEGIPDDAITLVAVPTLLLNEKQVRRLVEDLEVRFLGNHDRNMHFALVSDLPDSPEQSREDDPLVNFCGDLIRNLNDKYAGREMGTFFLVHRHRIYNPREKVWMGWERKRGKLLDLNRLLRKEYDSFPVKIGDLAVLPEIRFVITLDSDTELPRGSAHRMVGALAHPLNQAIIDPEKNIVVTGYGILQPRVGISVQSASRSRLAKIYSGQTGFDIYTRAVSDVYQDLYGEGSFAGKGIYEVDILHQVLDRRFPRNALLSHDLIEGAYARAALASDIEIIEDYPSHYSAHNRRKHRWLRGDWQIVEWLRSRVPGEAGTLVPNPISVISQWKILDNLRRSLVEPATLLLLVLGWLVLPGTPLFWTVATIVILLIPAWFQCLFDLVRAVVEDKMALARDAMTVLFATHVSIFLTLTFLANQMLLSLDAVARAVIRRMVTRERLLEWETAAEVELGTARRTALDIYLDWTPALAVALAVLVFFVHRNALLVASPILLLWAGSKPLSMWLNRPPRAPYKEASEADKTFLRRAALRTWRYFAEFSTKEHNWLVPDNVQDKPPAIAGRISPTNLGLLLNARQVACEFGYITTPEFAEETLRTLATVSTLRRYRGHLLNWYDTRTLEPLVPAFVSSVDSGNLVASLWTLQRGCLDRLHQPALPPRLADGVLDHLRILHQLRMFPRKSLSLFLRHIHRSDWLQYMQELPDTAFEESSSRRVSKQAADGQWFKDQARARLVNIKQTVRFYSPWLLPEFAGLRDDAALDLKSSWDSIAVERLPDFIDKLSERLESAIATAASEEQTSLRRRLHQLLPEARSQVERLIQDLRTVAARAGTLANEMDFSFLLNPRRKLLSTGFDADAQKLHAACYDLLASEARIAVFVAIAKDDIPQESWFHLGRAHTVDHGRPVLISWTGTMFEYLMPALWMQNYPDTLLERSRAAAVRAQRAHVAGKRMPWGISESAYFKMDDAGNYQYFAFGLPQLALSTNEMESLVISPYSTFLALDVDPPEALKNLRRMSDMGWLGAYGFYEAADFTISRNRSWHRRYELVPAWMAHHQGMSLLAIANFLHHGVVRSWFHIEPRVQATELLLHEKPVAHIRLPREGYGNATA